MIRLGVRISLTSTCVSQSSCLRIGFPSWETSSVTLWMTEAPRYQILRCRHSITIEFLSLDNFEFLPCIASFVVEILVRFETINFEKFFN